MVCKQKSRWKWSAHLNAKSTKINLDLSLATLKFAITSMYGQGKERKSWFSWFDYRHSCSFGKHLIAFVASFNPFPQGDISDGCKESRKPGRNDNLLCMKLKISAKNFALALKFGLITRRTNQVHKDSCFHLLMGLEISQVAKKRHKIDLCIPWRLAKVFMCLNHVAEFQIDNFIIRYIRNDRNSKIIARFVKSSGIDVTKVNIKWIKKIWANDKTTKWAFTFIEEFYFTSMPLLLAE